MSKELLPESTYLGRILNYKITKTKSDGSPVLAVKFQLKDRPETVYYGGVLKGDAIQHTLKAAVVMGLDDPNKLDKLADGLASGILDTSLDYEIVVGIEQFGDKEPINKVKFVNSAGGNDKFDMDKITFGKAIAERNLKGILTGILKDRGVQAAQKKEPGAKFDGTPEVDIPF